MNDAELLGEVRGQVLGQWAELDPQTQARWLVDADDAVSVIDDKMLDVEHLLDCVGLGLGDVLFYGVEPHHLLKAALEVVDLIQFGSRARADQPEGDAAGTPRPGDAFAALVRRERKARGLSWGALAARLGVSKQYTLQTLSGRRGLMSRKHWPALAEALGVTVEDLEAAAAMGQLAVARHAARQACAAADQALRSRWGNT